ncbi:hypothetical protein LWI29_019040 [Acer saccharum]|uniref:Uncharacterized protein n=1 Tax=Acer saccharum TaxID=4024 RepID=A0AA39SJ35_ACESA|nr:hypothetical protein LWI29_019040 [Acer saccharum]
MSVQEHGGLTSLGKMMQRIEENKEEGSQQGNEKTNKPGDLNSNFAMEGIVVYSEVPTIEKSLSDETGVPGKDSNGKRNVRKWKRVARGTHSPQSGVKVLSPLHRLLAMEYSSEEETYFSISEFTEYTEKPYEDPKAIKYKVNVNDRLRCPFCPGKKK